MTPIQLSFLLGRSGSSRRGAPAYMRRQNETRLCLRLHLESPHKTKVSRCTQVSLQPKDVACQMIVLLLLQDLTNVSLSIISDAEAA